MKLNRKILRRMILSEIKRLNESFEYRPTAEKLYYGIEDALKSLELLSYDGSPIDGGPGLRYDSQDATFHFGNTPIMVDGQFAQNKLAIQIANMLGKDSSPDIYHDRGFVGSSGSALGHMNESYASGPISGIPDYIAHQLSPGGMDQPNYKPMTFNSRGNFLGVADSRGNVFIYRPHSSGAGEYEKINQMMEDLEASGFVYDGGLPIVMASGHEPVYSDIQY